MVRPKKWTPSQEAYVRKFYKEKTDAQLAKKLGKTEIAVKRKRQQMGLLMRYSEKVTQKKEGGK